MGVRLLVVGLALASGCFDPKLDAEPFLCGPGTNCPPDYVCDTSRNVCVKQAFDAGPQPECQNGSAECEGDTLVTCPGGVRTETPCPVGCGERDDEPACLTLVPTDLPSDVCSTSTSAIVSVDQNQSFDTDECAGGTKLDDPPRCLVVVRDIAVASGVSLTVSGSRIPILVATRAVQLGGTIDVSAKQQFAGPGFAAAVSEGAGESADLTSSEGGGGGGHATQGGEAGTHPGEAYGDAELSPILPGALGGAGGQGCHEICPIGLIPPKGGGGGGALHLVACEELQLGAGAVLSAGGGGGPGGLGGDLFQDPGGGGGGGSGGSLLVEAPAIAIPNGVGMGANGGGGGEGGGPGADFSGPSGNPGSDATVSRVPAKGGSEGSGGGDGGSGGTANGRGAGLPPGRGSQSGSGGGGGGGAAGRIRLNARPDRPPSIAEGAVVSPAPSTGNIARR